MMSSNSPLLHDPNQNITFDPDLTTQTSSENPLDFLSFMLDQPTHSPKPQPMFEAIQPEAGPSNLSTYSASGESGSFSLLGTPDEGLITGKERGSGRGKKRDLSANGNGNGARRDGMEMDLDMNGMAAAEGRMDGLFGGNAEMGYNMAQAGLLQQQLEAIHMQSPLFFDNAQGDSSSYSPLAQMFLTSPVHTESLPQQSMQMPVQSNGSALAKNMHGREWSMGSNGIITPAPSGDMFPQNRTEMMSPMQLEMLARADANGMNGGSDFNVVPLLSPALSLQAGSNNYPSQPYHQSHVPQPKSPLEQLQEQQKQFQEQLVLLQEQQRQLQATAAAVAVAHTNSTTSSANPSPAYFSPLTSPALEPSMRFGNNQVYSPAFMRGPHPLSALSSPALNPVGSSGGAQQTLSPALGPQNSADLADPDYVRALVNMLDGDTQQQFIQFQHEHQQLQHHQQQQQQIQQQLHLQQQQQQQYHSPLISQHHQQHPHSSSISSPLVGPNRHSISNSKTRPSPMMKPTNHRSHTRQASGSHNFTTSNPNSIPNSPIANLHRYHPNPPGVGHLPPAYIDQKGVQQVQNGNGNGSTSSTPSPVDLSQMMPPPPVPVAKRLGGGVGVVPMTPASLMNLGSGSGSGSGNGTGGGRKSLGVVEPVAVPAAVPVKKPSGMVGANSIIGKRNTGVLGRNGNGNGAGTGNANGSAKRALAVRPAGSARKNAPLPPPSPAPETRKTSHKAAEQKRRDSLKAGFDELRLLLPPINTEALDPISGEPIPGSSAPRLLPKSSLVPDDNPNRGVSKVALLRFSNEYIGKLGERIGKRDRYIELLRREVGRLRAGAGEGEGEGEEEVRGDEGEDLLDMDMEEGEEDEFGTPSGEDGDDDRFEEGEVGDEGDGDEGMEALEEEDEVEEEEIVERSTTTRPKRAKSLSQSQSQGWKRSPLVTAVKGRPGLSGRNSSGGAVTIKTRIRGE